ncbi:mannan endo-1,4-beta-mannosidase [Bacteroidia bacterium]|nr:mannan endo-1,4-beta-mannosidase [Bacteroidia bacterium]
MKESCLKSRSRHCEPLGEAIQCIKYRWIASGFALAMTTATFKTATFFLCVFFGCLFSFTATAQTIRIEAENAVLSGGGSNAPQVLNDAGCSGGKYVDTREGNLSFSFTLSNAGYYTVSAKIKSPYGDKVNLFRFDGENTKEVSFPLNNTYVEIILADPYYLATGSHTIEMIKSWGWICFDYLEIKPSATTVVEFKIDPLVTPHPGANTTRLYQFLIDNFQHKIISGVMTLKSLATTSGNEQNEISWLYEKTGKKPALLGLDFMDHTNVPASWRNNPNLIQDAVAWKNSNGIVALCWHWRDPSLQTYEFYTERTNVDPRKIFEPQSTEYAAMMRDMDIVAGYLKELQEQDVPVLWRPLHEASGGWFWWGSQGPEACKKIWQIMFDKFTNEHHLNNLIWVWTSEATANALSWYPGDQYVDIIGMDIYQEGNHGSQMLSFEELKKLYNGKKLLALSECGSIPDITAMKRDHSIWSYCMPWYGEHTKTTQWNSVNDWTASLLDPDVISLNDMPQNIYTSTISVEAAPFTVYTEKQQLYIQTQYPQAYQIYLYDLSGKLHWIKRNLKGNQTFSLAGFNPEYYFVTIKDDHRKQTYKISTL